MKLVNNIMPGDGADKSWETGTRKSVETNNKFIEASIDNPKETDNKYVVLNSRVFWDRGD